jgi:hypothetical protein
MSATPNVNGITGEASPHFGEASPHFQEVLLRVFQEQEQIAASVMFVEEDVLASVAALGHVVRQIGHDDSGHPWHADTLSKTHPPVNRKTGEASPYFYRL